MATNEMSSDESSDDENISILAEQSVTGFMKSKVQSTKSFNALHKRLMYAATPVSGMIGANVKNEVVKAISRKGIFKMNCLIFISLISCSRDQENPILNAQGGSALYNSTDVLAPSLKPASLPSKKTLGKGWFDMEVIFI